MSSKITTGIEIVTRGGQQYIFHDTDRHYYEIKDRPGVVETEGFFGSSMASDPNAGSIVVITATTRDLRTSIVFCAPMTTIAYVRSLAHGSGFHPGVPNLELMAGR